MLKGHICTKSWGLWTVVQINPESEQAPKLSKLQKPPQTQKIPYVPLPHPVISLYLVIESSLSAASITDWTARWNHRPLRPNLQCLRHPPPPSQPSLPSQLPAGESSQCQPPPRAWKSTYSSSSPASAEDEDALQWLRAKNQFFCLFLFLFFNFLNFLNFETVVESNKNYKLRTSKSTGNLQGRVLAIVNQWVQE